MNTTMARNSILMIFATLLLFGCAIRPQPLTVDEIKARADADMTAAFADQEPVDGPITLPEAMARAILYNLDHRTALMEKALANDQLDISRYELLPSLAASAGYTSRSEYYGATSEALTGPSKGTESLIMSTSQEKDITRTDVAMVWNVLDFGVSYARARQQADNCLIIEEQRRKAVQTIMRDVRYAYWRAQGAEHLLPAMTDLLKRTQSALERTDQIKARRFKPLQEALEYQQALLENVRLIRGLIQEMAMARNELATLMNLPPGTQFTLAPVEWKALQAPELGLSLEKLEEMALMFRPELRESDYRERISVMEARKAILEMLPGISFNLGYNYDSNDYLYEDSWTTAGAAVSLNIFNLFSGAAKYRAARAMQELDQARRQAVTMAVLTQVNLAWRQYKMTMDEYAVNDRLAGVSDQLRKLLEDNVSAGKSNELAAILSATNALVAKMRHHLVYAELQNTVGRAYVSAGIDLTPCAVENATVENLARALKKSMADVETLVNQQ